MYRDTSEAYQEIANEFGLSQRPEKKIKQPGGHDGEDDLGHGCRQWIV